MFANRANQDVIFQSFQSKFVTVVLGSRRVGKTYLVEEYIKRYDHRTWVLLNMDDRSQRETIQQGNLKRMIEEAAELPIGGVQKIWLVIDEAQKCPALFDQVKILYDKFKDKDAIKIILTGSGYLHLHQLSAETLAGRVELFYLREFGLRETMNLIYPQKKLPRDLTLKLACDLLKPQTLKKHIQAIAPLRKITTKALKTLLVYGGLPEVLEEAKEDILIANRNLGLAQIDPSSLVLDAKPSCEQPEFTFGVNEDCEQRRRQSIKPKCEGYKRKRYLSGYLQTYLEKDVRDIKTIDNLDLYEKLMEIIAEQTGSVRQDQKILEALGCNRETLKKYRGYLIATLMYQEIYPFIGSSMKRVVKSPKGYLLNNGLTGYLTRLNDLEILEKTGLIGHRLENWFLNELLIWLDRDVELNHIYYWRTSAGVEVDFVVEKKPNLYPFEVTYAEKIQARKLKNLKQFLRDEPRAKIGYYAYLGDYHYDKKARICFLPAWAIC